MRSPWPLRILAVAGFLISVFLLVGKLSDDGIVGCGGKSGCNVVINSRWSQFFYVPVTVFSALLYAGLFGVTLARAGSLRPLRAGLAICLAGAALWFFGVMLIDLKEFCPWCTAAHAVGLLSAALLVLGMRNDPAEARHGNAHFGVAGGVLAVVILILGQLVGPVPPTHAISGGDQEKEDVETAIHARAAAPGSAFAKIKGRVVPVFDDDKSYNTATLPHVGPANAPHVIVKYFDYTCASCETMHKELHAVAAKHAGKICMIMLPVPLNRACNPHFPAHLENHEHACELTRLSLVAWRADPAKWPEVHEALFTRPIMPPEIAEIAVAQIVGEDAFAKAQNDPWVEELLEANFNDFRQLIAQTPKMPKLLVKKNYMIEGLTRTTEELLQILETQLGLAGGR